jgi:glycosyltransferase involved in cell wall biosynthesis
MTIYHGTSPEELSRSLGCIFGQSRRPEEFLVVVDGPVSTEVDTVLTEAAASHPELRIERLAANVGSGLASAHGLAAATGDFVARHDSDDVSLPERLQRQMQTVEEQQLDIVGSAMLEFEGTPEHVVGVRSTPLTGPQIAARAKINNPINNPTVVFRRELALAVGGYADLRYMQDYDLFARMLAAGAKAANLAEPLVLFHAGGGMLGRRGGWQMVKWEWVLQRRLREAGTIGYPLMARNLLVRSAFRLLPAPLLSAVYARLFRRGSAVSATGSTL